MKLMLRWLTRKSSGGVTVKETLLEGDDFTVGRGTGNAIFLADMRVDFNHARITAGGADHVVIECLSAGSLKINGKSGERRGALRLNEPLEIGPYRFILENISADGDITLSIELVQPLINAAERIQTAGKLSLDKTLPTKRRMAWVGFLTILFLFLALPLLAFFVPNIRNISHKLPVTLDEAWLSGEISNPHKNIAHTCETCHDKAFVMVQDEKCTACHTNIQHHVNPTKASFPEIQQTRCATCHKEHEGPEPILRTADAFCSDCHMNLSDKPGDFGLLNVKNFSTHPDFRYNVIQNPVAKSFKRDTIASKLREASNLHFPHDAHLRAEGVRSPEGLQKLECASCHVPDSGNALFQPVKFTENCASCHQLPFDSQLKDVFVPHGDVGAAAQFIRVTYTEQALAGGLTDPQAPAIARRKVGTPLPQAPAERTVALAQIESWASDKASTAMSRILHDERSTCTTCHVTESTARPDASKMHASGWQILPVFLADHWAPKAQFDHKAHNTVNCVECHAANSSHSATDVLLPDVKNCQACHGDADQARLIPSNCVMCHGFHIENQPLMHTQTSTK